ncbi:MAG: proline--tRNA ligase [Nitrospirae bacterium]|nr:MAG: proline--tRNA ligase [Nitrospirota bacterium]
MRQSGLLIPTLRDEPGEAEIVSHKLMLRAGLIRKVAAGVYTYLPLGLRVIRKVERIIREELNKTGAQEVLMPIAAPAELWQETGRWDFYGKELFRLKDRHERDFCLGPTHEEIITDLVRREVRSYRQLPATFYQIQTKFRDEIRPRFGLMRGREFIMKDAYSFDADDAGAKESYRKMYEAYRTIFTRCGLTFRPVEADTGLIGGTSSHEFMVLADTGEDGIAVCDACEYAANVEHAAVRNATGGEACPRCAKPLRIVRGIEVGHVFMLGTKYSEKMKAVYLDKQGQDRAIVMGCYGIGVGRTAAAAIEQNHDAKGIIWPAPIAPFHVHVLPLAGKPGAVLDAAHALEAELEKAGMDVLLDDRDERPGVKFNDADLIGCPYHVVIGDKGLKDGQIELKERRTGAVTKLGPADAAARLKERLQAALS